MDRILPYGIGAKMMGAYVSMIPSAPKHDFNSNNLGAPAGLRPNKAHQRSAAKIKARKRASKLGHK